MSEAIRSLLADDHHVLRQGMEQVLEALFTEGDHD